MWCAYVIIFLNVLNFLIILYYTFSKFCKHVIFTYCAIVPPSLNPLYTRANVGAKDNVDQAENTQ